jgi:hypothetical protein
MTRPLPGWTKPIRRELAVRLDNLIGPRLPVRPACAGHAPLFDLDVWGETLAQRSARHARAIAICRRCPALDACGAVLDDLADNTTGIWAAEILTGRKRPERRTLPPDPMHAPPRSV